MTKELVEGYNSLSKEDIKRLAVNIPMMLKDLLESKSRAYMRLNRTWETYKRKGAKGHELVDLYMTLRKELPEEKQGKYY